MRVSLVLAATLFTVASCGGTTDSGPPDSAPPSASASALPTSVVAPDCEPGRGRSVEQLRDLVLPPKEVAPVTAADGEVLLPGFTIPGQVVDAGCVITYDAPGGCLGAVRITAATIPAATIPGGEVAGQEFPAVIAPAQSRPAAYAPRACQVKRDGRLLTITRSGVVREGFSRPGVARPGGSADGIAVPTVRLEPVGLPDVDVDPGRLESRRLPGGGDVEVVTGEGRVSYVAPGSVLFDTESAVIRPAAESALRAIVQRIRAVDPRARLLVEGHTDDRGSAAYGLALSRRRAAAVAEWLAGHGLADARMTTRGLGERDPAVPNTSDANRARNRRVVITLLARFRSSPQPAPPGW